MRIVLFVMLIGVVVAAVSQQPAKKFEPATITSVEESQDPETKSDAGGRQYIVGLRTATHEYVVLYTPATGSKAVEYSVGNQVSILVLKETIRFSDVGGNTTDMPIISTHKIEPKASK